MDILSGTSSYVGMAASPSINTLQEAATLPSPTGNTGAPEVDRNCRLLGPFALVLQGVMGLLVIGSLIYKRNREHPRRKWKVWILDVTKQMTGQVFVHVLNIILSDAVAAHGKRNPCSLYFLNIIIDTTFGVLIIYITLHWLTYLITEVWGYDGFVSGQYRPAGTRGRPKVEFWFKQLATYLVAILIMKLIVTVLFWLFPFLVVFAKWLINLFGEHQKAQVFFVMAVVPLVMNVIQFWLIDSLLRHNPETSRYSKVSVLEGGAEGDHGDDDDYDEEEAIDRLEDARDSIGQPSLQSGPGVRYRVQEGITRDGNSAFVLGDGEDGEASLEANAKRHRGNAGPSQPSKGYGSTLKSPPLRPQSSGHGSHRSSLDELRLEAASILSDGKAASARNSNESKRTYASSPPPRRGEAHHLSRSVDFSQEGDA
ncbi:hypothetical protein K437DRAFT_257286 [Tilletiaria anomala UBC 951]|uniref:Uncharacterized protein n=1 Tax=Tilletiaria anomala (strain ATCC 24038 / CBS 436.72 / UBC 951) TaxID=1037660 RepID=A0A066VR34_TILAU|nr:uncharacterized protein K437DRAFT_257286 [Tilletiaria anomala UBC 951]KDN43896.1 hypothetical protein K437DRAFT_257286 [Tilletiaria anomala UBC 951]